ncbi:MAG TPA: methionyl-tRNA formyltransferase [Gemmatimonadaceae bacterium]|nr:methionyl-tRNA formyltransferase [Gemmatimonadaceae bacterium]
MARVAFLGSKDTGLAVLRTLLELVHSPHQLVGVVTPDDRADARSRMPQLEDAVTGRMPFVVASSRGDTERALNEWRPSIAFVVGWYSVLPLSSYPDTAFYGFHYSPLPRYRGNAPVVWQILKGEPEIGLTLFRFSEGMDEGDIVAQESVPLHEDQGIGDALTLLDARAIDMLREHLSSVLDGTARLTRQDHTKATYVGARVPEDGLIDWTLPAREIHNFVRAQTHPYPGAFTTLPDGRTLRIWRTQVDPRSYFGLPGAVAERHDGAVVVTCGEGALRILDAQIDGQPPSAPETMLKSIKIRLGRARKE